MPHLAVVALNVILITLILIFVRFRFEKSFAKQVHLALDVVMVVLLVALAVICIQFSTL